MNRLTYKEIYEDYKNEEIVCYNVIPTPNVSHQDCLNKLGQLEDIEEELGIDLITFISWCKRLMSKRERVYMTAKAFNKEYQWKGIWKSNGEYILDFDNKCFRCGDCENMRWAELIFDEYGINWAFTEEELKKGSE